MHLKWEDTMWRCFDYWGSCLNRVMEESGKKSPKFPGVWQKYWIEFLNIFPWSLLYNQVFVYFTMKYTLLVFHIIQKQHIIAEIRKDQAKSRKKKSGGSVRKSELVEQINDIIKDWGSFDLPAPVALTGNLITACDRMAAEPPSIYSTFQAWRTWKGQNSFPCKVLSFLLRRDSDTLSRGSISILLVRTENEAGS